MGGGSCVIEFWDGLLPYGRARSPEQKFIQIQAASFRSILNSNVYALGEGWAFVSRDDEEERLPSEKILLSTLPKKNLN